LWNAETGDIKQVFDTENDNDIVTSVAWMKGSSPVLAIGTSSKQIHLWDTTQFAKIKTYENHHDGRVSSLSWNPAYHHLLSSGSIDSLINSVDIRAPSAQSIICTF
jgi:WD40 repeat protein